MKIVSAEFVKSCTKENDYPREILREIAFVGRSNVGKSSLINTLLNRRSLAKTSSTPGKTRLINFFKINSSFYLVDLPGYGYTSLPKEATASWGAMIEGYLSRKERINGVILLMDIRRKVDDKDLRMIEWLDHYSIPYIIAATKTDKLTRGERDKAVSGLRDSLDLSRARALICSSSKTKEGKTELLREIVGLLNPGTDKSIKKREA
ncbi:MAG: ribosome biogenesis GTP-binding protein YihA/YsxC [Nitrospirota bacterium]